MTQGAKITDVKTVLLTGPCTGDPYILSARRLRSAALIEIHTDSQHVGIGETYALLNELSAAKLASAGAD